MAPRCQLLDLPREIRDMIYQYALRSHTGYVLLLPKPETPQDSAENFSRESQADICQKFIPSYPKTHPYHLVCVDMKSLNTTSIHEASNCPSLKLSLLETCKQIYAEAKDVPFEQNTFVMGYKIGYSTELELRLAITVQNAWIEIFPLTSEIGGQKRKRSQHAYGRANYKLCKWNRRPCFALRTITTCIPNSEILHGYMQAFEHCPSDFEEAIRYTRSIREEWAAILAFLGSKSGHIRRILEVNRTVHSGQLTVGEIFMLRELHVAHGGELWLDGQLHSS